MNLEQSSFKLFLANAGTAIITFLGIRYFAIELGATLLGVYFLFQAVVEILSIPADLGLRGALEKRLSEGTEREVYLSTALTIKFFLLIVIAGILYAFRSPVNAYIGANVTTYLILGLILREGVALITTVLRGELRVAETASIQLLQHLTWVLLGVALTEYGFGALGLIIALLAGYSVGILWGVVKITVRPAFPSRTHAHSLVEYGQFNFVSSVGGHVYNWMDIAIIGLFLSQAHVSAYEIAWRIAALSIMFTRSLAMAVFPQISSWDASDDRSRIVDTLPSLVLPAVILVIPAFFGTLILAKDLLRILFRPEYVFAWAALIVLMFDKVTEAFQLVYGRALQGIDRPDLAAKATIVAIALNLVLNLVLVPRYELVGAAIATTVASLIGGALMHAWYLSKYVNLNFPVSSIVQCILAAAGMSIVVYIARAVIPVTGIVTLIAVIVIGVLSYGVIVAASPPLRQTFKAYIKMLQKA